MFSSQRAKAAAEDEALKARLYQPIGQLQGELDWLKKNLSSCTADRRALIAVWHPQISIARQCHLLGLPRSAFYYQPTGESAENLLLLRLLDEQYTRTPFYGIRKMTVWLREQGHQVNKKRVTRLLRMLGLEALYPKPKISAPAPQNRVYPYLLRGVPLVRVNQVWSTDIT